MMADAPAYLTQRELAKRWRVTDRTLMRWRAEGFGPAWYMFGGVLRYRLDDIEEFERCQRRNVVHLSEVDHAVGGRP